MGTTGDLDPVFEHPALEQLERRIEAQQLLDRGTRRHRAVDETLPLLAVLHERAHAVPERVHRRLVPGVEEHDHRRHDLGVGQPPAVDPRADEARDEVVARRAASLGDELERVVAERRCRRIRRDGLLLGRVELVHLHHRVRPVEEVAMVVGRDAEPRADEADRVRLGEVVEEVHPPCSASGSRSSFASGSAGSRIASTLRGVNADATSLRMRVWSGGSSQSRLQRSTSQNADQRGSSGSALNSSSRSDVAVVAAKAAIAQARAHVRMTGDEPAVELSWRKHRCRLAKLGERGVRVGEELGCGGIEATAYSREPTYSRRPYTPSATSAAAAMQRPITPRTRPAVAMPAPPLLLSETLRAHARSPSESEGDDGKCRGDRDRESRVEQVVAVAEAGEKDRERQRHARGDARHERAPRGA